MADLANHLWQSTVFALAAAVLVAALRGNRAAVRHWIWVIVSLKWLVPFAWLIAAGTAATRMLPAGAGEPALRTQPDLSIAVLQFTQPFTAGVSLAPMSSPVSYAWLTTAIVALWACGVLALAAMRTRGWLRVRAAMRHSKPVEWSPGSSDPGIDLRASRHNVRSAPGLLEPGVVGIWRPVLLLPAGIERRLLPAHLDSIVAHELCHVRRRDNLTSAVHMVVEAVFWFHPLVWWIGARLIEERERACDEDVLDRGTRPRDYAEGLVRVCKLYVESPVACVSGVTGSNLKRRIEDIMSNRIGRTLSVTRKVMLTTAAAFAVAAPVVVGATAPRTGSPSTPPVVAAQSPQPPKVGDLQAVLNVMRDPAATAADRERLTGKTYVGIVVVDTVRVYPKAAVVVAVTVEAVAGDRKTPVIGLQFTGKTDDPKLDQLRKLESARLRGTLTRFRTEGHIVWAEFADLVVEEKRP